MSTPDIAEQIRSKIQEWQAQRDALVSEQAKQIIIAAVSAILYDPHPGWRLPDEMTPWPSQEEDCARFNRTRSTRFRIFSMKLPRTLRSPASSIPFCCCIMLRTSSRRYAPSPR